MSVVQAIHRDPVSADPLHGLLDARAVHAPEVLAYRFLADGEGGEQLLTTGELADRARTLAAGLVRRGAGGQPVLLIHPPGLEFIVGLFACWHAGAVAVPCHPPRGGKHRRRLESVLSDSGAKFALAPAGQAPVQGLTMLESESLMAAGEKTTDKAGGSASPCIIQYTSGSTASPKGVMISHANIRSHFASLHRHADLGLKSAVSWLPPYHDMGLVLKILYSFEAGIPLTFFTADRFIQRPVRWLRAISRYRAEFSGAPNFAFEMCLRSIRDEDMEGLDLSCWKAAPCGAERVRQETLERFARRFERIGFRPEAFMPGYGLAESTLTVTACPSGPPRLSEYATPGSVVSSGKPLPGVDLRIADTDNGQTLPDGEIGEIRIRGGMVSAGYWKSPAATLETFGSGPGKELRTGDLGFMDQGELFVTGRIKDLIIIDGANHSPEDIEAVVFAAVPEIVAAAVFAADGHGRESVQIAVEAGKLTTDRHPALCQRIRRAVGEVLEIPVGRVLTVRNGLLPRTTSGKIRRLACRDAISNGTLGLLFNDRPDEATTAASAAGRSILMDIVSEITGRDGARPDDDLIELGMTSMETTRLAALLKERTGAVISIGDLFSARSLEEISALIPEARTATADFPEVVAGSGAGADILTHSQERMWFLHQLDPESAAYHVFGCLELKGPLDVEAMRQSIAMVVSRHDILCSRHESDDGRPKVRVVRDTAHPVETRTAEDESGIHAFLTNFARQPFDLSGAPPLRTCIVSQGNNRHILGICVHHIAADGWSIRILAREIAAVYKSIRSGLPLPPLNEPASYLDYAVSHRRWIDGGAMDVRIDYWKSKLAGHPGVLQLATDHCRPPETSSDGGSQERIITPELCNRVSSLAKAHRSTPFMVHLAAFLLLLRRHGAGDDPVVAVPVANRLHAVAGDLVGTLVNTLPFRLPLSPCLSFSELVDRVRTATIEMLDAQEAPFEKIIAAVKPDRSRDHSPLAQVMFDYQEIPIAETWDGNLECRPFPAHRGSVQFDLSLLLTVLSDHQQLVIEYRTDLFRPETVDLMMQRYLETLETACREPSLQLSELSGLCQADRTVLKRYSHGPARNYPPAATTPDLIAERAKLSPGRYAVASNDLSLDYATLEKRSDALASFLQQQGIRHGDRLAVLIERDLNLPVALLAIWKAGAAYVPLDHSNPPERLGLILDDQKPIRTLVSPGLIDRLPPATEIIRLDDGHPKEVLGFHPYQNAPADTAYVIYTSGSTGRPKGVTISHGALANFLQSMAESPGFTTADRLMAVTTISFDISALELFLPLISGGCVDVVSTSVARDGEALRERLATTSPTVMQATPATWRLLMDSNWPGSADLRILCGGEPLDLALARRLRKMGTELWNLYGPTETTIWSTLWKVPDDPRSIRIGRPIANTGIHILAPDGSALAPGVPGELWISGAGLAKGYWNRADLTDACFVELEGRRYRTGDLGRLHADGNFECLGRSDGQVKIRGFRVELGEIESALARHPKIGQAKATLMETEPGSMKLIAWVVPKEISDRPSTTELRNFLDGLLPAYMLPSDIGVIDYFPLGASGKVEIAKLGPPQPKAQPKQQLTASERRLAGIWSELLHRRTIQREDDWFHIGGHSLLALRLFSRIRKDFQRSLPLSTILDHSTLADLASVIDKTPCDREITVL